MACYWPVSVWRGSGHLARQVPCGGCVGCRLERSRQWAIRGMHEASLYEDNCFVTLTYDDEHLPLGGSLDGPVPDRPGAPGKPGAFALFMKRLRQEIAPRKVRYLHAGEYGERGGRPHYHAVLFGYSFADAEVVGERDGYPVSVSATLGKLWPSGRAEIGTVTYESVAYVARYTVKKALNVVDTVQYRDELMALDGDTGEVWPIEEEYQTMSRNPGIGRPWLERFGKEVYPADSVVVKGRYEKPPRYYDSWFEVLDPTGFEAVCRKREREGRQVGEGSRERLAVREEVAKSRLRQLKRRL